MGKMVKKMEHFRLILIGFLGLGYGLLSHAQIPGLQSYKPLRDGNKALQQAQHLTADSLFQNYLKTHANNPFAQMGLGNALYQNGNADSARYWFDKASQGFDNPKHISSAHHNLGNSYMKAEKWKEAAQHYKEALKKWPENEKSRYNLAYALKKMQQEKQREAKLL